MKSVLTVLLAFVLFAFWTGASVCSADITVQEGENEKVPFATGGVGKAERDQLQQMAHQYNLKMGFAAMSGSYLTGVRVTIRDSRDQIVLNQDFPGPLVYTKLPRGTYQITASHHGLEKTQQVSVGEGLKTVLFHWRVLK